MRGGLFMKLRKMLTALGISSVCFVSAITVINAYETSISFTPTSATFEFDNRPYANDMKIDCYYRFKNGTGKTAYTTDTNAHYGVYINDILYSKNSDWGSDYAEMTYFINGQSFGTTSRKY